MFLDLPAPGKTGWAIDSARSPLPDGLPYRARVTVTGVTPQTVVVRDEAGRTWVLGRMQVDTGGGWWLDGEYCPETHPKAALHLRHTLAALEERMRRERNELHGSPDWWQEDVERARWYLTRNGHDPDESLPEGEPPVLTGEPGRKSDSPRIPADAGS